MIFACRFETQLHGSAGWSLGAALGYRQAGWAVPDILALANKLIVCIGAAGFQMAPQEISEMLKHGHATIIFLVNKTNYNEKIDHPYDFQIREWDYTWDYTCDVQ